MVRNEVLDVNHLDNPHRASTRLRTVVSLFKKLGIRAEWTSHGHPCSPAAIYAARTWTYHIGETMPDTPGGPGQGPGQSPGQDRPGGDRPGGDRPGSDRPGSDRPGSDKPGSAEPKR